MSACNTSSDATHRTTGTVWSSERQYPSLSGPAGPRASALVLTRQGCQPSLGADLQHCPAVGFLQVLQLPLVLLAHFPGPGSQGIFHAALAVLDPVFDLRGVRSNCQLPAVTVVLPWMISSTIADLRRPAEKVTLEQEISEDHYIQTLDATPTQATFSGASVRRRLQGTL